jgi:AraC-type transcriptional regulator N-terminus
MCCVTAQPCTYSRTAYTHDDVLWLGHESDRWADFFRWAGLEDETYSYAASEFLVVSVDLPAIGHVTVATPETPTLPCSWISIPGN